MGYVTAASIIIQYQWKGWNNVLRVLLTEAELAAYLLGRNDLDGSNTVAPQLTNNLSCD